jgi:hypothetical protein
MGKSTVFRYLHWILTALLLLGVVPAFRWVGLEFNFDWPRLLTIYWIGLTLQSLFATTLLCIVTFPLEQTLLPFWKRCLDDKLRLILVASFIPFMIWQFGWAIGLMLAVDVLMFLEVLDRIGGGHKTALRMAKNILVPAAYFFAGLILVFCYNDVIARAVDVNKNTAMYVRLDSIFLLGSGVSEIAHAVMQRLPVSAYNVLEGIYFGMFAQLGVGIFLSAVKYGMRRALAYVGTLLTAYYLALLVFALWPAAVPASICPDHFSRFPQSAALYSVQQATVQKPKVLFSRATTPQIDTDYFILLPCMHIALPMIMLWFIRKWRRLFAVLLAYDVILCVAILLLEQHFLIDLFGGAIAAIVAIALVKVPKEKEEGAEYSTPKL